MRRFIVVVLLFLCTLFNASSKAESIKVVFLNPGHPSGDDTGFFWSSVNRFMEAAAEDLDIELITLFAQRDHILMKQMAKEVVQYQPDYAIVVNEKGAGLSVVQELAAHNIPILMLLNGFTNGELESLSVNKRKLILGSLIPDNFLVGQKLMADLFAIHQDRLPSGVNKKLNVLALQGDYRSAAALERKRGMESFIDDTPQLVLVDTPVAHWSKDEAYRKVKGILRYRNVDIIWAANDPMAIGARKAILESDVPQAVTIGGINWDRRGEILDIDVSYGGHVTLGAKAMVMLHDYHFQAISRCEMTVKIDIFVSDDGERLNKFLANTTDIALDNFDFSQFSKRASHPIAYDVRSFFSEDLESLGQGRMVTNELNTCIVKN